MAYLHDGGLLAGLGAEEDPSSAVVVGESGVAGLSVHHEGVAVEGGAMMGQRLEYCTCVAVVGLHAFYRRPTGSRWVSNRRWPRADGGPPRRAFSKRGPRWRIKSCNRDQ